MSSDDSWIDRRLNDLDIPDQLADRILRESLLSDDALDEQLRDVAIPVGLSDRLIMTIPRAQKFPLRKWALAASLTLFISMMYTGVMAGIIINTYRLSQDLTNTQFAFFIKPELYNVEEMEEVNGKLVQSQEWPNWQNDLPEETFAAESLILQFEEQIPQPPGVRTRNLPESTLLAMVETDIDLTISRPGWKELQAWEDPKAMLAPVRPIPKQSPRQDPSNFLPKNTVTIVMSRANQPPASSATTSKLALLRPTESKKRLEMEVQQWKQSPQAKFRPAQNPQRVDDILATTTPWVNAPREDPFRILRFGCRLPNNLLKESGGATLPYRLLLGLRTADRIQQPDIMLTRTTILFDLALLTTHGSPKNLKQLPAWVHDLQAWIDSNTQQEIHFVIYGSHAEALPYQELNNIREPLLEAAPVLTQEAFSHPVLGLEEAYRIALNTNTMDGRKHQVLWLTKDVAPVIPPVATQLLEALRWSAEQQVDLKVIQFPDTSLPTVQLTNYIDAATSPQEIPTRAVLAEEKELIQILHELNRKPEPLAATFQWKIHWNPRAVKTHQIVAQTEEGTSHWLMNQSELDRQGLIESSQQLTKNQQQFVLLGLQLIPSKEKQLGVVDIQWQDPLTGNKQRQVISLPRQLLEKSFFQQGNFMKRAVLTSELAREMQYQDVNRATWKRLRSWNRNWFSQAKEATFFENYLNTWESMVQQERNQKP
ncbi:Hypothetical protein PBC10988_14890 [Planctomycetales bacterium 10988]|nr:Hypothetical protein PBC10988_14890 [Planctomycetales bacterium 10988]